MDPALDERKCKCPDAVTLNEYSGSVINWPHWNLEDCPVHKGDNPELMADADRLRKQKQGEKHED